MSVEAMYARQLYDPSYRELAERTQIKLLRVERIMDALAKLYSELHIAELGYGLTFCELFEQFDIRIDFSFSSDDIREAANLQLFVLPTVKRKLAKEACILRECEVTEYLVRMKFDWKTAPRR